MKSNAGLYGLESVLVSTFNGYRHVAYHWVREEALGLLDTKTIFGSAVFCALVTMTIKEKLTDLEDIILVNMCLGFTGHGVLLTRGHSILGAMSRSAIEAGIISFAIWLWAADCYNLHHSSSCTSYLFLFAKVTTHGPARTFNVNFSSLLLLPSLLILTELPHDFARLAFAQLKRSPTNTEYLDHVTPRHRLKLRVWWALLCSVDVKSDELFKFLAERHTPKSAEGNAPKLLRRPQQDHAAGTNPSVRMAKVSVLDNSNPR